MKTQKLDDLSEKAQERVLKPSFRGRFNAEDSAEKQLGLVSAGGGEGTIYWLVDMDKQQVEHAKFLSYGQLCSLPLLDVFSEQAIGKSIEDACNIDPKSLCDLIGLKQTENINLDFIGQLQQGIQENIKSVVVEKPIEKKDQPYRRKDLTEMDENDKAWIPLSAPQKIAALEKAIAEALTNRSEYQAENVSLYNIERDMKVKLSFSDKVDSQHKPTLLQFIAEHCRSQLHPQISIEEVAS